MRTRLLTILLMVLMMHGTGLQGQETPPNIVLIISDDQAWTDYSFMGHPVIRTPVLDKLASESGLFRRGYVPTALCRPSLMTLATGRYAFQHGVTGNDPSPRYAEPGSEEYRRQRQQLISYIGRFDTLPALLRSKGYVSLQTGKWWEGGYVNGGFTHGMSRGFPNPNGRHGDDGLKIGRDGIQPVTEFVDEAIREGNPFFVWYAPFLPHTPHNPPDSLLEKYLSPDRSEYLSKYYAMCEWLDRSCGALVEMLEEKDQLANTLIVYVTDNGWIQKPDGRRYDLRSKQTPYEGGVRTPILFWWPDQIKPADRPEVVSSIDLMPTILAAAGCAIPEDLPGENLLPLLQGNGALQRECIYGESFAHDIADIENPEATLLFRWCIQDRWKLILTYDGEVNRYESTHPRTEKRPQLFDLLSDPAEENNLAAQHPEIVAELAEKIDAWYPVRERRALKRFK